MKSVSAEAEKNSKSAAVLWISQGFERKRARTLQELNRDAMNEQGGAFGSIDLKSPPIFLYKDPGLLTTPDP